MPTFDEDWAALMVLWVLAAVGMMGLGLAVPSCLLAAWFAPPRARWVGAAIGAAVAGILVWLVIGDAFGVRRWPFMGSEPQSLRVALYLAGALAVGGAIAAGSWWVSRQQTPQA